MRVRILLVAGGMIASLHARADDQTNEDRLRDALRQTVAQMRAAEDRAAQAQADAQQAQSARQALQTQLDAANAKLAGARPAAPAAETGRLESSLAQAQAQNAALQQGLAKWQAAYNGAVEAARAKDTQAQQSTQGLTAQTRALGTCKAENTRLVAVGEQILHLYETESFRGILLRSYEPFVGRAKVTLENMVQDYDDKLHQEEYVPAAR